MMIKVVDMSYLKSYRTTNAPGRRFATGTTRGDHLLGVFGFVAHALLFTAVGASICWLSPTMNVVLISGGFAAVLLVIRGMMVGISTTKDSIAAIYKAWFD